MPITAPIQPASSIDPHGGSEPPLPTRGAFGRLGLWSARHRWWVVAAWVILLLGGNVAASALGGQFSAQFTLPASPAQKGADLAQAHSNSAAGSSTVAPQGGDLVFHVPTGSLTANRASIEASIATLRRAADVASISDPFAQLSPKGDVAVATITYRASVTSADTPQVSEADAAVAPVRQAHVLVDYSGDLGSAAGPSSSNVSAELIGIGIAALVLLLAFGSVLATVIPVASAAIGVFAGVGALGTLAAWVQFPSESPTIALMMGLGVGIDYALFLSTRYRQRIMDGAHPLEAAADTVASSGRAVVIAAITVVISLVGLYASGVFYIGQLGISAGVTVLVAALSAITLVPALLSIAGRRIDTARIRRPVAEPTGAGSGWTRYGNGLGRHPVIALVVGLLVLGTLAIPLFSMRLGSPGASAQPTSTTERRASDAVAAGFGVGYQSPLTIVIGPAASTSSPDFATLAPSLRQALLTTSGVASVSPLVPSSDGGILLGTVIPTTGPSSASTANLIHTLDRTVIPDAIVGTGAVGYVTGGTAAQVALQDAVSASIPVIILVVVAAAMLLILLTFRSPVLALKAGLVNLLSIGASYGVLVAVFQWGWGSSLLGIPQPVPIVSFVPMLMFAIVFGLSMDYEVFLLARIRESWMRGDGNGASVATGLTVTGRIISCAAVIMASVFFSFLLTPSPTIKMLALGLGVSVIIDATIVRLVIVPAAMFLFGRANWWTPRWLDRVLPHLEP